MTEAISKAGETTMKVATSQERRGDSGPRSVIFYIWEISPFTELPPNGQCMRDEIWSDKTARPTGHPSINSLTGKETGNQNVALLRQIQFKDTWSDKLVYAIETMDWNKDLY